MAADNGGNLYAADWMKQTISKITPSGTNGAVTLIAGLTNTSGSANGVYTNARFFNPWALAIDASSNLFVADSDNHTIRELTPSGTNWSVTTIAGLAGTAGDVDATNSDARFNQPLGLAVDAGGDLFVTEAGNSAVRRLTPGGTNWVVTTIAGWTQDTNSPALFAQPEGVVADSAGNVYVSDTLNHAIRKLARPGGNWIVTTIAGQVGTPGFADGTNSSARFDYPSGLALDNAGNLFVADTGNGQIREISPVGADWMVTTVGSISISSTSLTNPCQIAVDQTGHIYLANGVVMLLQSPGNSSPTSLFTNGNVLGVAVDSGGGVFLTHSYSNTICSLANGGSTWMATTLAGAGPANAASIDGIGMTAEFFYPSALAVDSQRTLYVADYMNQQIRKVMPQATASGTNWVVTTIGGLAGVPGSSDGRGSAALFSYPRGIAVDQQGNVYVADTVNNTVRLGQPNPSVQIALSGYHAVLSWPASATNWVLEAATDLSASNWQAVADGVATNVNSISLTNSLTNPSAFYRLRQQP